MDYYSEKSGFVKSFFLTDFYFSKLLYIFCRIIYIIHSYIDMNYKLD